MDKYLPLDKAAKQIGVSPKTLRRWLEKDLGLVFRQPKFQRVLVSERDLQELIRRRTGKREWPVSRSKTEGEPR
jgi:DNA-binding transcriptional MerR regulator